MARVIDLLGDKGFYVGEDFKFRVQVFDRDDATPTNLTTAGWTLITFTLKDKADDASALFQKTEAAGVAIVNADPTNFPEEVTGTSSVIETTIEDGDTDALTPGLKAYQVKRMDAGSEGVVVIGTVECNRAVSL